MADVREIQGNAMTVVQEEKSPPVSLLSKYLDGEFHHLKEELRQFVGNNKLFNMQ